MSSSQANGKSARKNVMKHGFWGVLLIAAVAIFATSGVRLGSSASDKASTISVGESLAAELAEPNITDADTDTLDLQLD